MVDKTKRTVKEPDHIPVHTHKEQIWKMEYIRISSGGITVLDSSSNPVLYLHFLCSAVTSSSSGSWA